MKHHYPVGGQYCKLTGKGSLVGIADDLCSVSKSYKDWVASETTARKARTAEMRDYKRESRAKPVKRMTLAMMDIIKYVKRNPGTRRADLLNVHLGGKSNVSTSSLGDNLAALVRQGFLNTNGLTQNRRYFINEGTGDEE